MAEGKNVYVSFISSLVIHSLIFSLYLYLSQARKADTVILENIELIEIEPDVPVVQEMPRQTPPKSVFEFFKMALPVFKKPEPQQIPEPEIESETIEKLPEKISLERTLKIRSQPEISLAQEKYARSEKLSEIIPPTEMDKEERLAMLSPQEPAIDLAEVGRIAVKETPFSQPLSLEKRTLSSPLTDFEEVGIDRVRVSYKPPALKESVISIGKKKPPVGKPILGYGKGISLAKKQERKPSGELKTAQPVTQKVEKTPVGMIREAKPDKKSVEILGPVVGRKILTSYLPLYPDWARAENIEADVVIRFYVSPQGMVREKLWLERTSGYSKLDQLAMEAFKKWIFEPIEAATGDQWGIITFRYLLE